MDTAKYHNPDSDLFQQLFQIGKQLLVENDVDQLLIRAMDFAVEISGAERGLIILFDKKGDILFQTARNLKRDIKHPEFEISRTLINEVKRSGKVIYTRNALEDPELEKSKSVKRLKILSVICFPLIHRENVFGVVYLDNRTVKGIFRPEIKPFIEEFVNFISLASFQALERKNLETHIQFLESELREKNQCESIITNHPGMIELLKLISQVADTDATVFIQGESGTGKELIARALHFNSIRKDRSFIPVNCAALPENLLESELFGHVKGAFTGALKDKPGWFERASGGTLFLDEIGEMTPSIQVKLLRILQTGEYSRVGSTEIRWWEGRIVTATSRDIENMVKKGTFREELYYRLNVIDMIIPPLRERRSDIPLLVQHFMNRYCVQYQKENIRFSKTAEDFLLAYDYPGNVRELENMIQRAVVLTDCGIIERQHLIHHIADEKVKASSSSQHSPFREAKERAVESFEREYLTQCLKSSNGNISGAARLAQMDIKNFYVKMTKYQIDPEKFKN